VAHGSRLWLIKVAHGIFSFAPRKMHLLLRDERERCIFSFVSQKMHLLFRE